MTTSTKLRQAQKIVLRNKGRFFEVKIAALARYGIQVEYAGFKWDFGKVGTVKDNLIQLECAKSRRIKKTGYVVNKCHVYKVL